jgi:tripartite-type tricarboxylate transporter receptor subunit TctC
MRNERSTLYRKLMLFKLLGAFLILAEVFPLASALAAADSYPSKPIRMVIASAPGASADIFGRLIAAKLSERLGKQVVPVNNGGAGGTLASEMVMREKPDGYTLLFNSVQIVLNPLLYKAEYDALKSFVPIAKMGDGPNVVSVYQSVPVNTVMELIALAKKEPGKLIASSSGAGSFTHLATELFMKQAGVDFKIVQFKGGGPALLDTIGGHSQVLMMSLTPALPQIKAGKLKALGVGGPVRSKLLPNVPTVSEAGLPGYEASQWWGIFAPAETPKAIVDRLYKEIAGIMGEEETKKMFESQAADPDLLGPDKFPQFIKAETAKWGKLIQENNIKGE